MHWLASGLWCSGARIGVESNPEARLRKHCQSKRRPFGPLGESAQVETLNLEADTARVERHWWHLIHRAHGTQPGSHSSPLLCLADRGTLSSEAGRAEARPLNHACLHSRAAKCGGRCWRGDHLCRGFTLCKKLRMFRYNDSLNAILPCICFTDHWFLGAASCLLVASLQPHNGPRFAAQSGTWVTQTSRQHQAPVPKEGLGLRLTVLGLGRHWPALEVKGRRQDMTGTRLFGSQRRSQEEHRAEASQRKGRRRLRRSALDFIRARAARLFDQSDPISRHCLAVCGGSH